MTGRSYSAGIEFQGGDLWRPLEGLSGSVTYWKTFFYDGITLASNIGVTLNATSHTHAQAYLFGEDQGRYLIATHDPEAVLDEARAAGVHAIVAGQAGGDAFASRELFSIPLAALRAAHEGWMPAFMGEPAPA